MKMFQTLRDRKICSTALRFIKHIIVWSFPEEEKLFFDRDPPKIFPECIDSLCVGWQHIESSDSNFEL